MGPGELQELWLSGKLYPPVTQHFEHHVYKGEAWRVSYYDDAVATPSGTVDILALPLAGAVEPSIYREISVHADTTFWAFEDFDISASGTALVAANYRRSKQGILVPTALFYHTPTITRLGTAFGPQFIPGGSTANAQGTTFRDTNPIILGPGIPALFRLQNLSGITGDLYMQIAWFEDEHKDPGLPGFS
jgi:hypothetical protein